MLQAWSTSQRPRRIDAAGAIDGVGVSVVHPGGVSAVVEPDGHGQVRLVALGPTPQIAASSRWAGGGGEVLSRAGCLLIPGLVNAHTHLDLTGIGPWPHPVEEGFLAWIEMIRRERPTEPEVIGSAVRLGVDKSLAGGTVLVGDIAGAVGGRACGAASEALAADGRINGVSYCEFFAQGARFRHAVRGVIDLHRGLIERLRNGRGARVKSGISPHAPYSVNRRAYDLLTVLLIKRGLRPPIATHVGESPEEVRLVGQGDGPFVDLLSAVGVWDDWTRSTLGGGETPLQHLANGRYLPLMDSTIVHGNALSDDDLLLMLTQSISCVYCPRASAYFGAETHFGPHRYAEMAGPQWGVNVALGTDSIVNLETLDRISVWDEMALLHRRDKADPVTLLRMATVNGAKALGRAPSRFAFREGKPIGGVVGVRLPETGAAAENRKGRLSELLSRALLDPACEPELLAIGRV